MICSLQSLVLHLWWRAFATILYYFNGAVAIQSNFDLTDSGDDWLLRIPGEFWQVGLYPYIPP